MDGKTPANCQVTTRPGVASTPQCCKLVQNQGYGCPLGQQNITFVYYGAVPDSLLRRKNLPYFILTD